MNNHRQRVDRLSREKVTISALPAQEELDSEIAKMQADPAYVCKWSQKTLDGWVKQLEAELGL